MPTYTIARRRPLPRSRQPLVHQQLTMPAGIVGKRPGNLEAVPGIEVGRLEGVRVKRDLGAATLACDCLDGVQESAAQTSMPTARLHPQRFYPAGSAPAP